VQLHGLEIKERDDEISRRCPEERDITHGHDIRDDEEEQYGPFPYLRRGEKGAEIVPPEDMESLVLSAPLCGGAEKEKAKKDEHSSQNERKQAGGDEKRVVEHPHPQGGGCKRRPEDDQAYGGDVVRPGTLVHSSCHVICSASSFRSPSSSRRAWGC